MASRNPSPRTFFLNEQHELSREEREGGGRLPKLAPIDWASRGRSIGSSLERTRKAITESRDPLKSSRYFLLAQPVPEVVKESKDKRLAPEGTYSEKPDYASSEHSRVFQRLGLDLLQVNDDGTATVHATPERIEKLILTAEALADVGIREQARWVTIDSFSPIPLGLRIDESWLENLSQRALVEAIIELQPLLSRVEIDEVMRAVSAFVQKDAEERLTGTGTDFSGRQWLRGRLSRQSLRAIAKHLFSIQSLHPPLLSRAASRMPRRLSPPADSGRVPHPVNTDNLPTIALLDTGVPTDHRCLAPYRRGQYYHQDSAGRALGDHGSLVASRIVFGDVDASAMANAIPAGQCRFYDVMVATDSRHVYDKSVVPSLEAVAGTAPDVRVFNLSFDDSQPLEALREVERRERLLLVQDLDQLRFCTRRDRGHCRREQCSRGRAFDTLSPTLR